MVGKGNAHGQMIPMAPVVGLRGASLEVRRAQCLSQCLVAPDKRFLPLIRHSCIEWILQFQCHTKHGWFRNA